MIASTNYDQFSISPEVDSRFFWWLSHSPRFTETVRSSAVGVVIEKMVFDRDAWLEKTIPLPPLPEQRRIVARIEELSAKIEEARTLRNHTASEAEAFMSSALIAAFTTQLGKTGWKPKPLSEAATIARGKFGHRPRNDARFYGGNIPFIQIGDISNSNRYIRRYSQTLNQEGLNISRMFPKGTVVIAITGATIGVTGILTFDSCFPDSIVGIEAKQQVATEEFVFWSLEYSKKQLWPRQHKRRNQI